MTTDARAARDWIIVYAKAPVAGQVKTRVARRTGDGLAVELYRAFTADLAELVAQYTRQRGGAVRALAAVSGDDASSEAFAAFADAGFEFCEQGPGNLGARLRRNVEMCRERGARRVVVLGTDSPTLHLEHLDLAFDLLARNDVVFGPSFDGGYYLVGLDTTRRPHDAIFERIAWSTPRVLEQSWERCRDASLLCDLMGFWYDVDTFEDVRRLRFHLLDYLVKQDPGLAPHTARVMRAWVEQGVFDDPSEA